MVFPVFKGSSLLLCLSLFLVFFPISQKLGATAEMDSRFGSALTNKLKKIENVIKLDQYRYI